MIIDLLWMLWLGMDDALMSYILGNKKATEIAHLYVLLYLTNSSDIS